MTEADNRPRVLLTMPSGGTAHTTAMQCHALATRGKTVIIPSLSMGPAPTHNHNAGLANALQYNEAGIVDYWICHHADIEINTHGWADLLIEEMRRVGAAVLSAVVPIKDERGQSSTAVETGNFWAPRKLTMAEAWELPPTFCRSDVPDKPGDAPGGPLLVNNGILLVDVGRPEFHRTNEAGDFPCYFTLIDRLFRNDKGEVVPCFAPDDWNFARQCHRLGLPVYATTKIDAIHHGGQGWSNQPKGKAR